MVLLELVPEGCGLLALGIQVVPFTGEVVGMQMGLVQAVCRRGVCLTPAVFKQPSSLARPLSSSLSHRALRKALGLLSLQQHPKPKA